MKRSIKHPDNPDDPDNQSNSENDTNNNNNNNNNSSSNNKKLKPNPPNYNSHYFSTDNKTISKSLRCTLWNHYRNYIDSVNGGQEDENEDEEEVGEGGDEDVDTGGDIDELHEILELLKGQDWLVNTNNAVDIQYMDHHMVTDNNNDKDVKDNDDNDNDHIDEKVDDDVMELVIRLKSMYTSEESLLPVLVSMVYFHLGNYAISDTLAPEQSEHDANIEISNNDKDEQNEQDDQERTNGEAVHHNSNHNGKAKPSNAILNPIQPLPQQYLEQSLYYFPYNAGAKSMLANYKRMNMLDSTTNICKEYEVSSYYAQAVRQLAILLLEEDDDNDDDDNAMDGDAKDMTSNEEKEVDNNNNQKEDDGDNDLEIMSREENSVSMFKEWVELLILDGIAGVEYIGEDDDDEDDQHDDDGDQEVNNNHQNHDDDDKNHSDEKIGPEEKDDLDSTEEEIQEEFSSSPVDATSSFMAALLNSTLGKHDRAKRYLSRFNISHRIHPNVWRPLSRSNDDSITALSLSKVNTTTAENKATPTTNRNGDNNIIFEPKVFKNNVLPEPLYNKMCTIFAPSASYWKDSNYSHRGYFSFFHDIPPSPTNIIEDMVMNHLLPRVKSILPPSSPSIVGFEWWTHTRPLKANLGHQLHFDTDEALLDQQSQVTHPIASSVLYLTCGRKKTKPTSTNNSTNMSSKKSTAGSTIIFDQTPDSSKAASHAWISEAEENRFMIFPGCYLHGVLPCNASDNNNQNGGSKGIHSRNGNEHTINGEDTTHQNGVRSCTKDTLDGSHEEEESPLQRLTFMVGFWTRRVPDNMSKDRPFYSPCGDIPPPQKEHSWVEEIMKGYPVKNHDDNERIDDKSSSRFSSQGVSLPTVSPAWECLQQDDQSSTDSKNEGLSDTNMSLEIPTALDHRFFVRNCPDCFRESLFQKGDSFC